YGVYNGGYSGSLTLSTAGTQGNTVYGYGQSPLNQNLANLDLNVLFQQANRLAENTQRLSGQATGDFTNAVARAAGGQAGPAEFLAKAQGLALIQQALTGQSTSKSSATLQFKSELPAQSKQQQQQKEEGPPPPMPPAEKEQPAGKGNGGPAPNAWAAS